MKEITHEDWLRNPTPREMWCWNDDEEERVQRKVVYFSKENFYPVIALLPDDTCLDRFQHCAEIGEQRRMTNKELSRWLRENPTREYKYENDSWIFSYYEYREGCEEEEVPEKIRIRENYGEWREPRVYNELDVARSGDD